MALDDASDDDFRLLREQHYNSTVVQRIDVAPGLMILRVHTDQPYPRFTPGQYTTLGLGVWEPRVDGALMPMVLAGRPMPGAIVRRVYSLSSPLWHDNRLVCPSDVPFLEFYIAQVSRSSDQPPLLTPRLFGLQKGHRLQVGERAHGRYTTESVSMEDDVVFLATGTGEAPHNAMLSDLLSRGHVGRIVSVVCVRRRRDLGYLTQHRELEKRFERYRYLVLTTREPENLDPAHAAFAGRRYIQDFVESGCLERELGYSLNPERTHVFLCGNPAMIGIPQVAIPQVAAGRQLTFPEPPGMVEVLARRGFCVDPHHPECRVHFERYW